MSTSDDKETARQIRDLEDSFCNRRKIKEAEELRQDLRQKGYTDKQIDDLAD